MLSFGKALVSGKQDGQELSEQEKIDRDYKALQKQAEIEKAERLKMLNQKTDFELEEEQEKQHAIDLTERKMLANQYAKQMSDDDKRDGFDSGKSNFQVIADQTAE